MNLKNTISFKLFFIGFLILVLMIPTVMVGVLINEREYRSISVQNEIAEKWGNRQIVGGPVLNLKGTNITRVLPTDLTITGEIKPIVKGRGIFSAILYTADLEISGSFDLSKVSNLPQWSDEATLAFKISDLRGLESVPIIRWDEKNYELEPGLEKADLFDNGLKTLVNYNLQGDEDFFKTKHDFNLKLKLNGSEELKFLPLGNRTTVKINSPWNSPSFNGKFLPKNHEIDEENGFTADWSILKVNRSYPESWSYNQYGNYADEYQYQIEQSAFGVKMVTLIDSYQQSERSVKYAILFIVLSFLTYFLVEVLQKVRIHPIQYLLVGFANVLFYLLLISLSEHITFSLAYIIASVFIVLMISMYTGAILNQKKMATLLGFILTALYIYLYTLLQIEDYALLIGSIGLAIILAGVMFLTRKIDWYKINA